MKEIHKNKLQKKSKLGSEVCLLVSLDDDVGGGVGDARQHPALLDLVVIEEAAVGLVDAAADDLAGAGGASTSATRVGHFEALLLRLVDDVNVVGALEL